MTILRKLGLMPDPVITTPPEAVELRRAMEAAERAHRLLAQNRRPTANRQGNLAAGYERPSIEQEGDRALDD